MEWIQSLDESLAFALQTLRNPVLDILARIFTFLGEEGILFGIAAIPLCITKRYRRYGIMMLIALAVSSVLGFFVLKPLIARPRPCVLFPEIPLATPSAPGGFSFPSGHTLMAFTGAASLWLANWRFGVPAAVFACLVAFSRLYLFAHFLTDIIAGIAFGIAVSMLVYLAYTLIAFRLENRDHLYVKKRY